MSGGIWNDGIYLGGDAAAAGVDFVARKSQSTSLLSGALMTINVDTAKFDIAIGRYQFVDYSDIENPVVTAVTLGPFTAITVTNIGTQPSTLISVLQNGTVVQRAFPYDPANARTEVSLGALIHAGGVVIDAINNFPQNGPSYDLGLLISDFGIAVGALNASGNVYSAASINLTIKKSAGVFFQPGLNFPNDPLFPNFLDVLATDPSTWIYTWEDGVGGFNVSVANSDIDPNSFDDGTGGALEPNGVVNANNWAVQRLFAGQANTVIQFGTVEYSTQAAAIAALGAEPLNLNPGLEGTPFRGWLIVRGGATDLSDTADALFVEASKFGATAGGGTSATSTMQNTYDNSAIPQILTSTANGAVTIRRGSDFDTDVVFAIQDGGGTSNVFFSGDGQMAFSGIGKGITVNSLTAGMKLATFSATEGIGHQSNLMEFITLTSSADWRWGNGSPGALTEKMFLDSGTGELRLSGGTVTIRITSPVLRTVLMRSGTSAASGINNTAFGFGALDTLLSGSGNVAVGSNALFGLTVGTGNVAVGSQVMSSNTVTGANNVGVGFSALQELTTGSDCVAIGNSTLLNATTASGSIAIGLNALTTTNVAVRAIAIGSDAMSLGSVVGTNNIGIGTNALQDVTLGASNVALGLNTAINLTTGSNNVGIGTSALGLGAVSGADNIGIGSLALLNLTSGSTNIAIGNLAMGTGIVTGNGNVAIGTTALQDVTAGVNNTALGINAAKNITTGDSNVAVGSNCLANAVTSSNNIAVGNGAMSTGVTTGADNIAMGRNALLLVTSGTDNIAIGPLAGDALLTGSGNILIGNAVDATGTGASNELNIGNSFYAKTIHGPNTASFGFNSLPGNATVLIDQPSLTGAIAVLEMDQADLSEEFTSYLATIGVGNPIEAIAAKSLTTTHFIKIKIQGGLIRYFPVGTIA